MIEELAQELVAQIFDWGYIGIAIMMALESSFIPFPSEIVLIPSGYLASQGNMNIPMIMLSSLIGSMIGAFVNYYLALFLGRSFLQKYGKYFFIKESALKKMDNYFEKYGAISTFLGRLVPGIRQLISIPAGLAKMNVAIFATYTALGSIIWGAILIALGYFIGQNQELINIYLKQITMGVVTSVVLIGIFYYIKQTKK